MTLLPSDHLVSPVAGHDDLLAFRQDFLLAGKALEDGTAAQTVTEEPNGDLVIEGYAAVFDGLDREGENFVPGAFDAGVKAFLDGQAALCFHHKHDHVIGKVLDLNTEESKGLKMRARVDFQEPTSPMRYIYDGIRKGSINGLSIGGFFKRALVQGRKMISNVDFTEISTTGVPVHAGTNFSVVAGKALMTDIKTPEIPEIEGELRDSDIAQVNYLMEELGSIFDRLNNAHAQRKTSDS